MKSKKYELIIFDCDGTLVDSEPVTNRLIADMINERGINISKAECLHMFAGKTIKHITDFIKTSIGQIDVVSFESEYRSRSDDMFKAELKAIDGVHDLLRSLDIPFCVASNGPKVKMQVTLPATGLDRYFDDMNMFSAYDINSWKPEPHLFKHAAHSMGVPVERALVLEDTWSGVMGAINGDIDVWAFNPHFDQRLYLPGIPNFSKMSCLRQNLKHYL